MVAERIVFLRRNLMINFVEINSENADMSSNNVSQNLTHRKLKVFNVKISCVE